MRFGVNGRIAQPQNGHMVIIVLNALTFAMQLSILSTVNGDYRAEPVPSHLASAKEDKGRIEQSPGYADYAQGLAYGKQEHYDQAIEALNRAETKGFKTFNLFLLRGQAYLELKRYEEAQDNASQAIAIQPRNPTGYSLMR